MREIIKSLCAAAISLVLSTAAAAAQDLVGTWKLVSETVQKGDQTVEPLGDAPLGSMMLDPSGRFMLIISRPDIGKIAAGRRDAGTAEENKAILAGMLAFFGTYKTDMASGILTIHVEASTFPNWIGSDQRREFTLAGDEMTLVNRAPAISGEMAKLVWRRLGAQ